MNRAEIQRKLEQARKDRDKIDEEIKELEEELKIKRINVGDVYRIPKDDCPLRMITTDCDLKYILTAVGGCFSGCWSSYLQGGPLEESEMIDKLNELDAEYLGRFDDLFVRLCNFSY